MSEQQTGRLSAAEHDRIFRDEIAADYLPRRLGRSEQPSMAVVVHDADLSGTNLAMDTHRDLSWDGPAIRFSVDDLSGYHPASATVPLGKEPARHVADDAKAWAERLIAAASRRRASVVMETSDGSAEDLFRVLKAGRAHGYPVEVHALAIHPRMSWQETLVRSEELRHAGLDTETPTRRHHDETAARLGALLTRLERDRLADAVHLRRADGITVYHNRLEDGKWRWNPEAARILKHEHERPRLPQELERFTASWSRFFEEMQSRGARDDRLDVIRSQAREDVAHFLAQRRRDHGGDTSPREQRTAMQSFSFPASGPGREERGPQRERPIARGPFREESGRPGRGETERGVMLAPGRVLPDLSAAEIDARLDQSQRLAGKRAEIERLARLVHGNAVAVSETVRRIDGSAAAMAAAGDVRTEKLAPMAGDAARFLRRESEERRVARTHLPQLAAALEDYGRAVEFERHAIEVKHREDQHRMRQDIPAPSPELGRLLAGGSKDQSVRLNADPGLRQELDKLTSAIHRRLSRDDRVALNAGDTGRLARSLGVSRDQAAALARIHSQAQATQQRAQAHLREMARSRGTALSVKK